jgi:hypothetical protein
VSPDASLFPFPELCRAALLKAEAQYRIAANSYETPYPIVISTGGHLPERRSRKVARDEPTHE